MALTGSLQDNFDDNSKDTAKWAATTVIVGYLNATGSALSGTATETGGQVVVAPSSTSNTSNGYSSFDTALDLRASSAYVKVTGTDTDESEFYLTVADTAFPNGSYIHWRVRRESAGGGGGLTMQAFYFDFGNTGTAFNDTWDATNDVWLRIREAAGTIYWDTAPDSSGAPGTWVNKRSYSWSFSPENLTVGLYASNNAGNPGISWSFDNFNTAASTAPVLSAATVTSITATTATPRVTITF